MSKTEITINFRKLRGLLYGAGKISAFECRLGQASGVGQRTKDFWKNGLDGGDCERPVLARNAELLLGVVSSVLGREVSSQVFLSKRGQPYVIPVIHSGSAHEFCIRGYAMPGVTPVQSFVKEPASTEQVSCTFDVSAVEEFPAARWSSAVNSAYRAFIAQEQMRARAEKRVYDNGWLAGLLDYRIDRRQTRTARQVWLTLTLRRVRFYHFQFIKACLAGKIRDEGNPLDTLPVPSYDPQFSGYRDIPWRIGVGTIVLTADGFVVVPLRSKRVSLGVPGYAESVGEGMMAGDLEDGYPSIGATCMRSLKDELGLEHGRDYERNDVRVLAFLVDWQILEPFFSMLVKVKPTFDQVRNQHWPIAKDKWENDDLLKIRWTGRNARMLIAGQLAFGGQQHAAASVRARVQFGLAYSATLEHVGTKSSRQRRHRE